MFPRVGEERLFHVATLLKRQECLEPSADDPRAHTATSAACRSMTMGCASHGEPKDQIKVLSISPGQLNPLQAAAKGQPRQLLYDVHNSQDADFWKMQGGTDRMFNLCTALQLLCSCGSICLCTLQEKDANTFQELRWVLNGRLAGQSQKKPRPNGKNQEKHQSPWPWH